MVFTHKGIGFRTRELIVDERRSSLKVTAKMWDKGVFLNV